jgi:hypothetical protein
MSHLTPLYTKIRHGEYRFFIMFTKHHSDPYISQFRSSIDRCLRRDGQVIQWKTVDEVYHATNKEALSSAEESQMLICDWSNSLLSCSLFNCNRGYDGGRPSISPYASRQVVIPVENVFESPQDFLVPINGVSKSKSGNYHVELLYIKYNDVDSVGLAKKLRHWQLENHPYIRMHSDSSNHLEYCVANKVWWLLLNPYEAPIPDGSEYDEVRQCWRDQPVWVRHIANLELARIFKVLVAGKSRPAKRTRKAPSKPMVLEGNKDEEDGEKSEEEKPQPTKRVRREEKH